jgi:hypothetical protein
MDSTMYVYTLTDFQGNESSMIFLFGDHWRYKLDSVSTHVHFWNKSKHFPCHIIKINIFTWPDSGPRFFFTIFRGDLLVVCGVLRVS